MEVEKVVDGLAALNGLLTDLSKYLGSGGGENHEANERASETLEFAANRAAEAAALLATLQARNEQLEAQLDEARADERERCAKVADTMASDWSPQKTKWDAVRHDEATGIARAIRALTPGCEHQTGPIGDAGQ